MEANTKEKKFEQFDLNKNKTLEEFKKQLTQTERNLLYWFYQEIKYLQCSQPYNDNDFSAIGVNELIRYFFDYGGNSAYNVKKVIAKTFNILTGLDFERQLISYNARINKPRTKDYNVLQKANLKLNGLYTKDAFTKIISTFRNCGFYVQSINSEKSEVAFYKNRLKESVAVVHLPDPKDYIFYVQSLFTDTIYFITDFWDISKIARILECSSEPIGHPHHIKYQLFLSDPSNEMYVKHIKYSDGWKQQKLL